MSITDAALDLIHYDIPNWICSHGHAKCLDDAIRYTHCLTYYVSTGRLCGSDVVSIARWNKRTISLVARALVRAHADQADYHESIEAVRKYF